MINNSTDRRTFIKQTCLACIGITAMGSLIESCGAPKSIFRATIYQNAVTVPKLQFATTNCVIVRPKGASFDIALIKENERYKAIEMRCTHNDIPLSYTGKNFTCNAHGSIFDLQGNVVQEPAVKPLTNYQTSIEENAILIHLHI